MYYPQELKIYSSPSFFDGANGFMLDGPMSSRKKRDSLMYEAIESCETKCKRVFDIMSQGNSDGMLARSDYNKCLNECR